MHQLVAERMDVYTLVQKEKIKNAIIFLKDGTGVIKDIDNNVEGTIIILSLKVSPAAR